MIALHHLTGDAVSVLFGFAFVAAGGGPFRWRLKTFGEKMSAVVGILLILGALFDYLTPGRWK